MKAPWNRKSEDVKKQEVKPPELNPISQWYSNWRQIQTLYPIGHEFRLLNYDLIVNKYINVTHDIETPALVCLYFDNSGSMRQLVFDSSDWECLIKSYKVK